MHGKKCSHIRMWKRNLYYIENDTSYRYGTKISNYQANTTKLMSFSWSLLKKQQKKIIEFSENQKPR